VSVSLVNQSNHLLLLACGSWLPPALFPLGLCWACTGRYARSHCPLHQGTTSLGQEVHIHACRVPVHVPVSRLLEWVTSMSLMHTNQPAPRGELRLILGLFGRVCIECEQPLAITTTVITCMHLSNQSNNGPDQEFLECLC